MKKFNSLILLFALVICALFTSCEGNIEPTRFEGTWNLAWKHISFCDQFYNNTEQPIRENYLPMTEKWEFKSESGNNFIYKKILLQGDSWNVVEEGEAILEGNEIKINSNGKTLTWHISRLKESELMLSIEHVLDAGYRLEDWGFVK